MALAPTDGGTAEEDAHAFDVGSDSDDSGWLIEESRITFTEAGYTLYSNGFDEELEEEDAGAEAAQEEEDSGQDRPALMELPPPECTPPAPSGRPWRVGGIMRVVDDGSAQELRVAALGDSVSASVRAAMAQLQVRVPPQFEHVPPAVLDTEILAAVARKRVSKANTPTEPFSTEPGGFSSSFAAFEKRDGPKSGGPAAPDKPALAPEEVAQVPLDSECGADYTLLRDLLAAGEWEKADDETRLKLCQLAGEEAEAREWVYFTEVKTISATDLRTMDALWTAYSRGRYGFSVQRQLWLAEKRRWGPFFTRVGWTTGANNAYRKFPGEFLWQADAPKGHLPLTNCLRGTQLFSELLQHPAFGGALEPQGVRAGNNGATSMGGATLGRGGPPPLEQLEPSVRLGVTIGALFLIFLGLANQQ